MLDYLDSDNIFANSAYLFEQTITHLKFDSQRNCQELMEAFPHLKVRTGFALGHYYKGDYRNATKELYACGLDCTDIYKPVEESELRRRPRFIWTKLNYTLSKKKDLTLESVFDDKQNIQTNKGSIIPPYKEGQFIVDTIPYRASKTVPPLNQYIELDFTPISIWEAVLLLKATRLYLPHRWHGCYNRGHLVYDDNSLEMACNEKVIIDDSVKAYTRIGDSGPINYQGLLGDDRIPPSVEVISDDKAIIKYCYWNNWEGLVRKTLDATWTNQGIELSDIDREELLKYNIGIRF